MAQSQPTDGDDTEDTTAEVEDIEQLTQRLELKQIHEARQDVMSVRNTASEQIASAGNKRSEATQNGRRVYLDVVKTLCLQLAPLIRQYQSELWADTQLMEDVAQFDRQRPTASKELQHKEIIEIDPGKVPIEVTGIRQLLGAKFPYNIEYEVTTRDTATGGKSHVFTQGWLPTFAQIDGVVLEVDRARDELGLGVNVNDSDDEVQFDYSDLE